MPNVAKPVLPHWDTLKDLDRVARAALWQQAFGRPLPPKLYKNTIVMLLGYRLQELELGGLSPQSLRYLNALLPRTNGAKAVVPPRRLKPGTQFRRTWQGRVHTVTVAEKGFLYGDQTYASLSVIARVITGTPWSGPAFFGLRDAKAKKGVV